jgi:hypothetical protein
MMEFRPRLAYPAAKTAKTVTDDDYSFLNGLPVYAGVFNILISRRGAENAGVSIICRGDFSHDIDVRD